MKLGIEVPDEFQLVVVPYIGTWIETPQQGIAPLVGLVVPYIGTWIETFNPEFDHIGYQVVPYIGTWIETISINA